MRYKNDNGGCLAVIIAIILIGLITLIPAGILSWVWAGVIITIWTNLPQITFWQWYGIWWFMTIVGGFFKTRVTKAD